MLQNGGDFKECKETVFTQVPTMMLLKIHKYLNWADKKLHSVFFIENKDQISDDMLADFKEGGAGATGVLSQQKLEQQKKAAAQSGLA